MFELCILDGLNELVPGAQYEGDLLEPTQEAYDAIKWLDPRPKPTWEEVYQTSLNILRRRIADQIDAKTRELIIYGFEFDGTSFYMPLDWQFDVLNLFLIRDKLTYPYKLKVNSNPDASCVYYELADSDHFAQLYNTVFAYIKQQLDYGRQLKDQLKTLSREELENWLDPRGPVQHPV